MSLLHEGKGDKGQEMIDQLKQCPFCGSETLSKRVGLLGSLVLCHNCEARGPLIHRKEPERFEEIQESIIKWNSRISNDQ